MTEKLAPTFFETGPRDEVQALDVYKNTGNALKTAYKRIKDTTGEYVSLKEGTITETALAAARGKKLSKEELFRSLEFKPTTAAKPGMIDRLVDSLARTGSNYASLTDRLQQAALESLGSNVASRAGIDPDMIVAVINNVSQKNVKMVGTDDMNDAKGIFTFINDLVGNSQLAKIIDRQSEMALLSSVVSTAIRLGVPDVIDELIASGKADKEALNAVLGQNLKALALRSDLKGLKTAVNAIGPDVVRAREPDLVQYVMSSYRFRSDDQRSKWAAQYALLKEVIELINPKAFLYKRNGETITELTLFSYASDDAIKLFTLNNDYPVEAAIAKSYRVKPYLTILKDNYPLVNFPK